MKVGLVFGGRSAEHRVSVVSARTIAGALSTAGHEVVPVAIGEDGSWRTVSEGMRAIEGELDSLPGGGDGSSRDLPALGDLDVAFPTIHGTWGEDGSLQGLFEMLDME